MDAQARFNIGEAAARSGVSAKMVRHYESLGLLPAVGRSESGYRQYGEREVHMLRFIKRARDLGFPMAQIAELVKLWQNRRRSSADVRRIASRHMEALDRRIAEMAGMRRTLEQLVHGCGGDDRPDCPILDALERPGPAQNSSSVPGAGSATTRVAPRPAGVRARA